MASVVDQTPNTAKSLNDIFNKNSVQPEFAEQVKKPTEEGASNLNDKTALVSPTAEQFDELIQKLALRLENGHGEVIYNIGTGDNGSCGLSEEEMDASVATLESMASTLEADCVLLRKHKVEQGHVSEYLVRKRAKDNDFVEVRVAVGANAGIVGMTKEHLGLALALNVPVFVVVTKIDMCPANILHDTMKLLVRILKSPGCRKIPVIVHSEDDVIVSATNFVSERLCPIFQVSNVTGENLGLLKMFLNLLSTRMPNSDSEPAEFQIDDTYSVPGVGTVVSGTTLKGTIRLNDTLMLGPDPLGHFQPVAVKSIHRKRMPVKEVRSGQTASFALKKIRRSDIRKGMVMVSPALNPEAYWEFKGEILVLHHPTTISPRYQAMVHCGSIRQTASILSMSMDCLRTGDKALVHFRFIKNPEYLRVGMRMVFREGRTKAVGNICLLIPNAPPSNNIMRSKPIKMRPSSASPTEMLGKPENEPRKPSKRSRGRHRGNRPFARIPV
ncbi:GTP-binding protein 1-like protein [Argiope bruennichi]|uniref:GTP-binding protein 1-like protein n=1 Tax=Argiope bruennichi TaxID=94029 RepID=A0A8T0FBF2_ARGBR|nr:GTP-binding protein 1-like protein [Argiope bruennichi]